MKKKHNPPHIHAIYGDDMAAITISDGKVLDGALPEYCLSIQFAEGCTKIYNVRPLFDSIPMFANLENNGSFR